MSLKMEKSNSDFRFDVFFFSDDEFCRRVTHGVCVEVCDDDVTVFIGQGNIMTILKAIDVLAEFAIRTGYGDELIKFFKEKGNEYG